MRKNFMLLLAMNMMGGIAIAANCHGARWHDIAADAIHANKLYKQDLEACQRASFCSLCTQDLNNNCIWSWTMFPGVNNIDSCRLGMITVPTMSLRNGITWINHVDGLVIKGPTWGPTDPVPTSNPSEM